MEKQTVIKGQKELKRGYTTGTCAAAAAKAAAIMLFSGEEIREVRITVPAGETLLLEVEEIVRHSDVVSCAVRKDAGDDPGASRVKGNAGIFLSTPYIRITTSTVSRNFALIFPST